MNERPYPRATGTQQTGDSLRAEAIRPYPQSPKEALRASDDLRVASMQWTSVNPRATDRQWTDDSLRGASTQRTSVNPRVVDR